MNVINHPCDQHPQPAVGQNTGSDASVIHSSAEGAAVLSSPATSASAPLPALTEVEDVKAKIREIIIQLRTAEEELSAKDAELFAQAGTIIDLRRRLAEKGEDSPLWAVKETPIHASDLLIEAADTIDQRGKQRDQANGERSMARTVAAFNALTGKELNEVDGWKFMAVLKLARSRCGHNLDDYIDGAAYMALAGEAAEGCP